MGWENLSHNNNNISSKRRSGSRTTTTVTTTHNSDYYNHEYYRNEFSNNQEIFMSNPYFVTLVITIIIFGLAIQYNRIVYFVNYNSTYKDEYHTKAYEHLSNSRKNGQQNTKRIKTEIMLDSIFLSSENINDKN